jgi:hypothetical protein
MVDFKKLRQEHLGDSGRRGGNVGFSNRGGCKAKLRSVGIAWGEAVLLEEGKWLGMREWYACFIDGLNQAGLQANATFREFSSHLQRSKMVEKRFVRKHGSKRTEYRHIDAPNEEE